MHQYIYNCIIARVIDGDTIVVHIDLGFDTWLKNQYIRLHDIDAPEIRTLDMFEKEKGLAAKGYVEKLLPVGSRRTLYSYEFKRGKYGRIIGDFGIPFDPENPDGSYYHLSFALLENGYAEPYEKRKEYQKESRK